MTELFYMGGPLFMGILTIILIISVTLFIIHYLQLKKGFNPNSDLVKEAGIFAFVFGIFGQTLGLYSAFSMIEQAGMVSPEMLISGLKISSITTIYGIIIFLLAYLLYFTLKYISAQNSKTQNSIDNG